MHRSAPAWLAQDIEAPLWLRAPVDQVLEGWAAYVEWSSRYFGTTTPEPVRMSGPLPELIEEMAFTPRSSLLVATDSEWTACYGRADPNRAGGLLLSDLAPCDRATFRSRRGADGADFGFSWQAAPATRDEAFCRASPPQRGARLWEEDGKWHFEQHGDPFPFEDVNRYPARRRRGRLDEPALLQYAWHLGIPIDRLDAYIGEAALLLPMVRPQQPIEHTAEEEAGLGAERFELVARRIAAARVDRWRLFRTGVLNQQDQPVDC